MKLAQIALSHSEAVKSDAAEYNGSLQWYAVDVLRVDRWMGGRMWVDSYCEQHDERAHLAHRAQPSA